MASSRNRPSADPACAVRLVLAAVEPFPQRIAVGLSGGVDSVVLLHVLRGVVPQVSAIHVNHGISPNARKWERFCSELCAQWDVPLEVRRFRVKKGRDGLEAAAREARLEAFAGAKADAIALAHQLDDQAETVLHNLLRGTGLRGASGMPAAGRLGKKRLLRPLLGVPRETIVAYARKHRLEWIEDESNADTKLTRNFIRHEIAPLLAKRFPRWRESLARAARHFAEEGVSRQELLRAFLADHGLRAPGEARLAEMVRQVERGNMAMAHDGKVLRAGRGRLEVDAARGAGDFVPVKWRGEAKLELRALGGTLRFQRARGGIDPALVPAGGLVVALRRGGERLRLQANRPSRTLKNLYQEADLPTWQRARLPLVYCGDKLVCVPGIGVDAAFAAPSGKRGWLPVWKAL